MNTSCAWRYGYNPPDGGTQREVKDCAEELPIFCITPGFATDPTTKGATGSSVLPPTQRGGRVQMLKVWKSDVQSPSDVRSTT